jgi:hypothetical protein
MHTCLTLTNVGGQWYVEREVSGLIKALRGYCDSIHSCDINVAGPSGAGEARCWSIALRIRIFDEILRIAARVPEGSDSQQSLSRALADVYARARIQLSHVSAQHGDCCAHDGEQTARQLEGCARSELCA